MKEINNDWYIKNTNCILEPFLKEVKKEFDIKFINIQGNTFDEYYCLLLPNQLTKWDNTSIRPTDKRNYF